MTDIDGARTLFSLYEDLRIEEVKVQTQRQEDIIIAMRDERDTLTQQL